MITWQEVLDNPAWKDLSSSEQAQARAFWVDQEIIPELQKAGATESDINGARYEANAKWDNGVGLVSSFGSAAAQGLLNTGTSAVQGLGALVGSEDLERVGREAQKSVNDTFRTNPLRENTNLVGNVLGNVVGFLGTGGIGGVAGKSLGAAKGLTGLALEAAAETGAQVGSLGTGFLAGAGGGAQDADQYGMTGAERYARVLGGGAVEVLSELAGGTGAELRAIGRIPGLKGVGSGRTGGFLHALGTESGEEVLAQIGGNALNTGLAPEGVQTPGLFADVGQAAAGGALGGAMFGGINALRRSPQTPGTAPLPPVAPPPSESITRAAQEQALAAGDTAAAAAMQAMNPNPAPVAQTPPAMQGIPNPLPALEAQAEIPFDPTLGEEFNPNPQPEPVLPPPDVPGLATDQAAVEAQAVPQPELPQAQARAAEIQAPTELPPLPPDGPFLINDGNEVAPPVAAPAPVVEEPALPPGQPIQAPVLEATPATPAEAVPEPPAQQEIPPQGDMSVSPEASGDVVARTLRPAYDRLVQRSGADSVFISDLINESGLPADQVKQWLRDYGINQGQATLDTGDWSVATEEQRAANVMLRGQERLYVRLHPGIGTGPAPQTQASQPAQNAPAIPAQTRPRAQTAAQRRELWGRNERIPEAAALRMGEALRQLGVADVDFVVNDTGWPEGWNRPETLGSRHGNTVYLNRNQVRGETPLHEVVHGVMPEMRQKKPELWEEGASLLNQTDYIAQVRDWYQRNGLYDNDVTLLEEVMTTVVGAEGVKWLERYTDSPALFRKIQQWAAKAKVWIKDQMRAAGLKPNQSIRAFANEVNMRILAGELRDTGSFQQQQQEQSAGEPSIAGDSEVFWAHGRITEQQTEQIVRALEGLGVTQARFVINDTGLSPAQEARNADDISNARPVTFPLNVKAQRFSQPENIIYLNRNKVTADTPMHEVFHGLIPELQASRPDLYQQGADILRGSPAYAEIERIYSQYRTDDGAAYSPERIMEEALATVLGNESPEWLRNYSTSAPWFQALLRWIAKVRVWLTDTLGNKGIDPDMTLQEFVRDINRRVLSGQLRETGIAEGQGRNDFSLNPNRQEPREQIIRPTGLSQNQPNNPVRQMVNGINYRGESGEQAMAEATALYNAGQAQGWDFQQHMGQVTQLLARTQGTFNMTPGAYMGLMAHGLALMKQDTSLSMAEREAARTNLRTLMDLTAGEAAAGGQFVKGFDLYLRIMNDPEIQVENMSMRAAVGGEQAALKEFRQVARTIQQVMQELQNEALRTMPLPDATTAAERTGARLAQGDETAIEGEIAIEKELTPEIERTEREASVTDQDWFKAGVAEMSARTQALVEEWLITLEALSLKVAGDSDFSLTPQERSAKAEELAKQFTRDQLKKKAEDLFRQISRQRVEATGPSGPQDVKGMVKDRLTKNLNRLLNGKAKRKKSSAEQIAATIANVLLAKAGHGTTIPAGQDALVFAMGLALSNQQLARESVADIHGMLQANAETKDAISQEKLKGFMSLMTGNDLSAVQGESVPYGERQIAQLLRNELAIQNTTLAQSVRTAALQGQTVEQLEANLRDPFRGLSEAFEPAVLDRIVNAVKAQYSKSAKERAETIARRQANRDALAGAVREARNEQREKRQGMERARREQERANERVLREQERAREMEVRRASAEERKQLARDIREARAEQRQKRQALLRAERLNQEALDRAERAELRRAVDEAKRDARDRKRAHLRAERNNRAADRRARVQDMRQNPGAAPEVRFQELNEEERRRLLNQPRNRVIDYLSREFGFNVNDIVDIARGEDRQATLEQRVLDLADQLGLTREQAEEFMRPVVAEAMKRVDGKRRKEAERKINDAISKLNGTFGRKAKKQPTAVERLRRLMELGGLDVTGIEKVLLNSVDAKEFSPELKDWLQKMVARSNDPSLPQTERDNIIMSMNTAIRSAQGASLIGLFGEWTMSNIFFGLSTFKVNAFWGGVKAVSDSVVYAQRAIPQAVRNEFGIQTRGLGTALFKQAMRGYSSDLQYHSKYLFKTGRSALESDYTTKFTDSEFELLAAFPDTQIKKWLNGEPLSPFWANKVKTLAKFSKYVRRTMVATDLLHRNQAYEMLKAGAIVKLIAEKGGTIPNTAEAWTRAIDDAMYGGDFQAAKQDAMRQADDDIAAGRAQPQERGILFGEYLDRKLGESLGISETQRREILDNATERAKRWTNADQTQGVLGLISTKMMEAARDIPGVRYLLPAIRMPINAFSQGLDWSPYAFLRYMTIKQSGNRSSSFTNHLFNRDGAKKSWHMPAQGITEEEKIELMTKATLGTATMVALFLAAALDWDKDDDEADFYITGRGPTDPQQAKLWRERGYRPFMIRIGGVGVNYQESPAFAPLAVLGATSDANRYGKPEDTRSDKLAYAITRSMAAFADAAVLRNLNDVLSGVTGSQTYNPKQAGQWTSRLAGVAIFPRVGSEINTILWGPQSTKELGWAARALGNVPFIPAITNRPALNWFGEEIHGERGGPMGEVLPLLAHRISPIPLDDDQMEFVAKMGAAPLQTRRRLKNGDQVMEDYDLMRQWAANSGKALRKWLTPEVMARYRRQFAQDRDQAEKDFDEAVREIRNNELLKFPTVQF